MNNWNKKLELYDRIVATQNTFKRKGKTMPYTSTNGYMFSMLNKAGEVGMRLSKESREAFTKTHNGTVFKSYGAVIREYVHIPDQLLTNLDLLAPLLMESYNYTESLPPK